MFARELHVARDMLTFLELEHMFDATELHGARKMLTFFQLAHMFCRECCLDRFSSSGSLSW